jgi:hypothetical protein
MARAADRGSPHASAAGSPKTALLFLHVHRTGGAALTGVLANRFAARDCLELYTGPEPDLGDLDRLRYVSGHVDTSFIERFTRRPFVFTMLRDPIERALSAYAFTGSFPLEYELPPIPRIARTPAAVEMGREWWRLARECELDELISRAPEVAREFLGNRQARVLCSAAAGEETLAGALEGLDRCDFVGLTERLDDTVGWLTRRLGWRDLHPLPRTNVTGPRLRRDQIPTATMETLVKLTEVDRELHRRGVERYERQVREWSAMRDPRDRSARIPDASPVSDLRFDQAIPGGGWLNRESAEDGSSFCWIGSTRRAWVEVLAPRQGSILTLEIPHAIDDQVLSGLRVLVGDRVVPHAFGEDGGVLVATARLPRRLSMRRRRRISIEVDRSINPREVNPESLDNRELAIAVRRVAVRPA